MARCPLDAIETSDCSSSACPPFYYAYGDGSLIANLYRHTLSIPLIIGRRDGGDEHGEFVYTSLLRNPKHPYFYSVGLAGISVGKRDIPAPEILRKVDATGSGGVAVTLRFAGNDSSVVLPRRNYFYEFLYGEDGATTKRRVGCMMLMNGGDDSELSGGPGATLGNYQQQGFEVIYDLEKQRVGFARRQCALLWDSLNREKN
ncbi:hypothetical protein Ahy_A05g024563 isoform A [Arachis hypogaea]|uniref:Xylanase inhibitor C-terminal domain-containing protein n=1 Tax=Arachis hypogaea TaxID=3818 RepID=A0A445D6R2_ARAHY|nr:hypothetical protein Ahy_A05g024563 isoform A [Arachis hypogaea]